VKPASKQKSYKSYADALRAARLQQKRSQSSVAHALNLTVKQISAIEKGQLSAWQGAYEVGYVKSYGRLVGVKIPDDLAAETAQPSGQNRKRPSQHTYIISSLSVRLAFICGILGLLGYVLFQVISLTSPPPLTIYQPARDSLTHHSQTRIIGKTSENTDVSINGVSILTDPDGSFSLTIPLQPGINEIEIKATNKLTKYRTVHRTVIADYDIDPITQQE